eukprot:m.87765 g.87765  ORF g.87765 m.87765 type:complete len:657 (+) comp11580_c0_seq1:223-2193(+)
MVVAVALTLFWAATAAPVRPGDSCAPGDVSTTAVTLHRPGSAHGEGHTHTVYIRPNESTAVGLVVGPCTQHATDTSHHARACSVHGYHVAWIEEEASGKLVAPAGCCSSSNSSIAPLVLQIRLRICARLSCDGPPHARCHFHEVNINDRGHNGPESTIVAVASPPPLELPPQMTRLTRTRWAANDAHPKDTPYKEGGMCYRKDLPTSTANGGALHVGSDPGFRRGLPGCRRPGTERASRDFEVTRIDGKVLPYGPETDAACRAAGPRCIGQVKWESSLTLPAFPRGCGLGSCFDVARPGCKDIADPKSPLPVYFYPRHEEDKFKDHIARDDLARSIAGLWQMARERGTAEAVAAGTINVVTSPDEACVLVALDTPAVGKPAHWGAHGANHLLLVPNIDGRHHPDRAGLEGVDIDHASLYFSSHTTFTYRPGIDLQASLSWRHCWDETTGDASTEFVPAHPKPPSERPQLLYFRGSVHQGWFSQTTALFTKWMADRWSLVQLHDPSHHVQMEATDCDGLPDDTHAFRAALRETKYAFTPSGGGSHSYRLWEALAAGAIPVVTSDVVLPLDDPEPVGDLQRRIFRLWRECVVVVEPALIPQVTAVLEAGGNECAATRQAACIELFRLCFAKVGQLFSCPAQIMADRARKAVRDAATAT